MSLYWNGAEVNTLMYNGVETTGVYNGNIVWGNTPTPVAPFNVVDSATWNLNYGITWGNSLLMAGISTANYIVTKTHPNNSQLYRKVTCNSQVRITALQTNSNQGVNNVPIGVEKSFSPTELNTTYGLWESYSRIYDNNLNQIQINSEPLSSTNTVGSTLAYYEAGDGKNYIWYIINLNCDVTLSAGDYWFPCFQRRHGTTKKTHYGFYSAVSGDMMALRQWDITTDTAYPPAYYNTSSKPYLKLTDENGNDWYV
jgi:hypothetical protein